VASLTFSLWFTPPLAEVRPSLGEFLFRMVRRFFGWLGPRWEDRGRFRFKFVTNICHLSFVIAQRTFPFRGGWAGLGGPIGRSPVGEGLREEFVNLVGEIESRLPYVLNPIAWLEPSET